MAQSTTSAITTTALGAVRRILTGSHAAAAIAGLALVVTAGVIHPGDNPGTWAWIRLLIAAVSAGIARAMIDSSRDSGPDRQDRFGHLVVAGVFLLLTVLLSATFTYLAVVFALMVIGLIVLHLNARGPTSLPVFWALLGILIPFWVWSAFDAWDRFLLMLMPLGLVGIISLEHALRADLYNDPITERYAAWIGIVGLAAILVITAMANAIDIAWIVAGAFLTMVLAAVDLMPARRSLTDSIPSLTLPTAALLVLMMTWLVAL